MIGRDVFWRVKASFRGRALAANQAEPAVRHRTGDAGPDTMSTNQAAQAAAMQALFFAVALLLIADLHSSLVAGPSKWEANPVVAAIAENVGLPVALATTKLFGALLLRALYAIWRCTAAHAATATVLGIVALHYLPVVLDNYAR